MTTPATPEGPHRFDHCPPVEAVVREWTTPLPGHETYHRALRDRLRQQWPALAAALDRLAEYERTPPEQRRAHRRTLPPLWQERSDET